jgi:hypothetical protein
MKAVDLHGLRLRPLPKELFDVVACVHCRNRPARWEMAMGPEMAWNYACSLCFLYGVPFMKKQREAIDELTAQIEFARKETWKRTEDGKLIDENAADCVAFGIVMAQRYLDSRRGPGGRAGKPA